MRNIKLIISMGFVFLIGLAILLYPTVSNMINTLRNAERIADYENFVSQIPDADYSEYFDAADEYNQLLANKLIGRGDESYNEILNLGASGMMGYLEIPKIKVRLPIYHGVDEKVLQIGVGHIEGTSLPVGGESTHSVLSGHRGLPSATLLTNLNRVVLGDEFYIYVLDEILAYRVDDIRVVLPSQVDSLAIEKGKDYVTLVTCTPYGINSHRLLVRGTRTEYREADRERLVFDENANVIDPNIISLIASAVILAIFFTIMIILRVRRNRKSRR